MKKVLKFNSDIFARGPIASTNGLEHAVTSWSLKRGKKQEYLYVTMALLDDCPWELILNVRNVQVYAQSDTRTDARLLMKAAVISCQLWELGSDDEFGVRFGIDLKPTVTYRLELDITE